MPDIDKLDLSIFLEDYLDNCREGFQAVNKALLALEKAPGQTEPLNEIFRHMHTLKSSSAMLEFSDVAELAHSSENLLDRLRKNELTVTHEAVDFLFKITDKLETMVKEHAGGCHGGADIKEIISKIEAMSSATPALKEKSSTGEPGKASLLTLEKIHTVKVDINLLDAMFNIVGELIVDKKRVDTLVAGSTSKDLKTVLAAMDRMINELQENVSTARLVPVGEIFQKFPRMIRDLAIEAGKEIELILEGSEIEMDKAVLDTIGQPLIHLLRNAVDHGIETADFRQQQGKKRAGTITLAARRMDNHVLISVADDGAGIEPQQLKAVFIRKGLIKADEAESMQDSDILEMLFQPGVSSSEKVTGVSGRGVGLDVVSHSVKELGGTVNITTEKGRGTTFTLRLPLTTAVMQTLMIGVGKHIFAIPTDIVQETLQIKPQDIRDLHNQQGLILRGEIVPFVRLHQILNIPDRENPEEMIAIIVNRGNGLIGVGVDTVMDQADNIIKPFDTLAQHFAGFSGGTIMGDGRVALLLDIPGLLGFATVQKKEYVT
jgi:two-component system, chemotaxis family, sensor kinase CheA